MYEIFKTFQTLIVGGLGFLGVMGTLGWNAHLQRQQEERQKRREANALRTALIEELKQQRDALQYTADSLAEQAASIEQDAVPIREARAADRAAPRGRETVIPVERYDRVFRASFDKLGLLERRELEAVFEACLPLPRLTWRLRILEETENPDGPLATAPDHVFLSPKNYETAGKMHAQMVPAIDVAIKELERNQG
jgi:hypothetical protein